MSPLPLALHNPIQRYAWGSTSLLQQLCGWPVDGQVVAEIWYGTHPRAPSRLARDDSSLLELVSGDPQQWLGQGVAAQAPALQPYPEGLPYLLKLLAVEHPLSLQVHPNQQAARLGFDREEARAIPLTARERCYPDPHHKPELLVALSEFKALVGFDSRAHILTVLAQLQCPQLDDLFEPLRGRDDLSTSFSQLMSCDAKVQQALLLSLQRRAAQAQTLPANMSLKFEIATQLLAAFPGDLGAVVSLLLQPLVLHPGEAVYVAPGLLHAYLHGIAVEIMANSDNVLRCGLTSKHVNVPELLHVLDVSLPPQLLQAREDAHHSGSPGTAELRYPAPASEFLLSRWDLSGAGAPSTAAQGPEILLGTHGELRVVSEETELSLHPGEAAFVPPGCRYALHGRGQCFRARAGRPS